MTPTFRLSMSGAVGNRMLQYMAALKLKTLVPELHIANVKMPEWGLDVPDCGPFGRAMELASTNRINFAGIASGFRSGDLDFVSYPWYAQRVENYLHPSAYTDVFPVRDDVQGWDDEHLVISLRGGEILDGRHPSYTLIPIDFYRDIVRNTGLRPVFMGQIGDSPYAEELRRAFPEAEFHESAGAMVDFARLRQSRNVLPSISTFAWLACWLAEARVVMPVYGLFNPFQEPDHDFLPLGDERYSFHLFPVTYSTPVQDFRRSHEAIGGLWRGVSRRMLRGMLDGDRRITPPDSVMSAAFDADFYLREYPDIQAWSSGSHALAHRHYREHGRADGRKGFAFDPRAYVEERAEAAFAIANGEFRTAVEHRVEIGHAFDRSARRPLRAAVCAIVKNEAPTIAEWIAYHLAAGFDTILVYDHGSTDGTAEVVQRCRALGDVRLASWSDATTEFQVKCYDHGLGQLQADADWVLFIDTDEFFVAPDFDDARAFLRGFEADVDAVCVAELFFGTSGHRVAPDDLAIRAYTRRAFDHFQPNQNVKSFVRTGRPAAAQNPHFFKVEGRYVDVAGDEATWLREGVAQSVRRPDIAHVNHYFTKSRADWDKKMRRGYPDGTVRSDDDLERYDRNEVCDHHALRHLVAVQRMLEQVGVGAPLSAKPLDTQTAAVDFDPALYLAANADVAQCGMDAWHHYVHHGRREHRPLKPPAA